MPCICLLYTSGHGRSRHLLRRADERDRSRHHRRRRGEARPCLDAVSYTHLDVYKRQLWISEQFPYRFQRQLHAVGGGQLWHLPAENAPQTTDLLAESCLLYTSDGLVYPDRRPHTGLLEFKNVYRPARVVKYDRESGMLTLHNYMDFVDLTEYAALTYQVSCCLLYSSSVSKTTCEPCSYCQIIYI